MAKFPSVLTWYVWARIPAEPRRDGGRYGPSEWHRCDGPTTESEARLLASSKNTAASKYGVNIEYQAQPRAST